MRYKIITPTGQEQIIEHKKLSFDIDDERTIIYGGENENGALTIVAVLPIGGTLIVLKDGEDTTNELHNKYIEAVNIGMKYEYEINKLKSRNLWQRIFNL